VNKVRVRERKFWVKRTKTLDFILLIQYKKDWRKRGKISLPSTISFSKMFVEVCNICGSGVGM
jgi:hypothetical protein